VNNDIELTTKTEDRETYLFRLYVAGLTPRSVSAVRNIRTICSKYLEGRSQLEIIDIYQQPHLASEAKIMAIPTLVRISPLPERRFIGDLSITERILAGLDITKGV